MDWYCTRLGRYHDFASVCVPMPTVSYGMSFANNSDSGKAYGVFNVKWLFLTMVVTFEVGSALCGAAPTMDAFIVGRVIQGLGT